MRLTIFNLNEQEKSAAIEHLITASSPRQEYFLMIVLSVFMATFGLLADSIPVVIGSMLVAPLLSPVLSFSLGLAMSGRKIMARSLSVIAKSIVISVVAALVIALFDIGADLSSSVIKNASSPSLLYVGIAVVAGLAATFATIRPNLSETLPGVAIAVTLLPPLSVIGIGIANLNWSLISGASLVLVINILGIVFASLVIFSLSDFYIKRYEAGMIAKKEDRMIEIEKKEEQTNNGYKTE